METTQIQVERFDALANESIKYVFDFMVNEKATFARGAHIVGTEKPKGICFHA